MKERLKNILPDVPALVVVLICGAIGALLSCWWKLSIGEREFASGVAVLPILLRVFLGSFGAAAAVFILAKTDTTKLIHCGIIAGLAGMAGPYLIIKALSTVVSVESNLVQIGSISVVRSTTAKLNDAIQTPIAGTNPQKIIDVFDQTAQATASYLTVLKSAPEKEKQSAIADSKGQLSETVRVLGEAAGIVPKQAVPLIKKIATDAKEAGLPQVAQEAQKILDTNSAVRTAAETAENIGKVYFITPDEVTDSVLHELRVRIRARFPLADIQAPVHPPHRMDPGLEVVYYRDNPSDERIADDLGKVVIDYLKERKIAAKIRIRKQTGDQVAPPFQFDIHIGPDISLSLAGNQ